jgi:hypothetical protein
MKYDFIWIEARPAGPSPTSTPELKFSCNPFTGYFYSLEQRRWSADTL